MKTRDGLDWVTRGLTVELDDSSLPASSGTYWLMGYPYQYSSLVVMFKETFEMPDMSSQLANTIQLHRIGSATLR